MMSYTNPNLKEDILGYHKGSVYSVHKSSSSPPVSWENEPSVFRSYTKVHKHHLPLHKNISEYFPTKMHSVEQLSYLLFNSVSLSCKKMYTADDVSSLTVNPTAGNLQPLELFVVLPFSLDAVKEKAVLYPGVYHYDKKEHSLGLRREITPSPEFPSDGFWIGISGIAWRETWKYGMRSLRYMLLDLGHAIASLQYAARSCGLTMHFDLSCAPSQLEHLLGISNQIAGEEEHCCFVLRCEPLQKGGRDSVKSGIAPHLSLLSSGKIIGAPKPISKKCANIYPEVSAIFTQLSKIALPFALSTFEDFFSSSSAESRKSWVTTPLEAPRLRRSPFVLQTSYTCQLPVFCELLSAMTLPESLFLGVFVHNVENLNAGVYIYCRNPALIQKVKKCQDSYNAYIEKVVKEEVEPHEKVLLQFYEVQYRSPCEMAPLPEVLPGLFFVRGGDYRHMVKFAAGGQDFASNGCFTLMMGGFLYDSMVSSGPGAYKQLHLEAGASAHSLCLCTTLNGLATRPMGAFFDTVALDVLGLGSGSRGECELTPDFPAVLYMLGVGKARTDERIAKLDPYVFP
eukprot:GCRY01006849.1.p1 GENE.GCRY01006849.1~~GCRY01006849.1.p1  ORF type:complete len:568 (-),score=74.15 GCRY01006849.1:3-1706(-)